jgi:hypothetical protein
LKTFQTHRIQLLLGLLLLFLYFLPYLIFGKDTYIYALDNLDGVVPTFHFLSHQSQVFADAMQSVKGNLFEQPRACYGSEWNVQWWLYAVLSAPNAYLLNAVLVHLIAYAGAYLLSHELLQKHLTFTKNLCALAFALLPFWYAGGLSIAAQPLLLYAFVRISKGAQHWWLYLLPVLYAAYSSFFWAGIFFLFFLFIALLRLMYLKNNHVKSLLLWYVLLALLCLASEHQSFELLLQHHFISHRSDYHFNSSSDFSSLINNLWYYLKYGHYQALSLHMGPLLLLIPLAFVWKKEARLRRIMIMAMSALVLLTFLSSGFIKLFLLNMFREDSFFNQFDFSRLNTLMPLCVLLLLIFLLRSLDSIRIQRSYVIQLILCLQLVNCFYSSAAIRKTLVARGVWLPQRYWYDQSHEYVQYSSFHTFYMEDNFNDLKRSEVYQKMQQSYCVSIGFHPGISLYHDLPTMDGYLNLYSKEYKDFVMQVTSEELKKNKSNFEQLRNWGNRCYFFAADVHYNFQTVKNLPATHLSFDWEALRAKGCRYVLSVGKLSNESLQLRFENHTQDADLYVYEIEG